MLRKSVQIKSRYAIHGGGQDGQVGYVHSDGSITWSSGDTQSYGDLSAPTTN